MVSDEMRYLENYFGDVGKKVMPLPELYEMVQYAGNVLPRL